MRARNVRRGVCRCRLWFVPWPSCGLLEACALLLTQRLAAAAQAAQSLRGYRVVHPVCSAVGEGGEGVFHKGWWGPVWCTRCAVLWGRGGEGVFHKGWRTVWYTQCAVLWGGGGGVP